MNACRFFSPLVLVCSSVAMAAPVFEDGFEAPALGTAWSVTSTNQGRVQVSTGNAPATGTRHLVLDDSVSDAIFSSSEATLALDLTGKKSVVLSFKAKSLGNEPHLPPSGNFTSATRTYDGVAISADGGTTWRNVQSLSAVTTSWQTYTVTLDSALGLLGGSFGPGFRIRFSAYDNSPAPIDGIAIDDVSVTAAEDQRLVVELPSDVMEGTGPHIGYVMSATAPSAPMAVALAATPTGQLSLPDSVIIPAGSTYQSFTFSAANDELLNGARTITVNATATGATAGSATIVVNDDDAAKATLVLPAELTEGDSPANNATLSLDRAPASALTFTLVATPSNELTIPSTVTIPAGQTQTTFTAKATNDTRIDGNLNVSVTATASGSISTSATTRTIDNESTALTLTIPATLQEGASGSGTVAISGTLADALVVSLSSQQSSAIGFPATVTIPAGQTQAAFTVTATDNSLRDGTRVATLSAQASGFTSQSKSVSVRDNEPAAYLFGTLPDIVNISSPVAITLSASDAEGNAITGATGTVTLSVVLPDGTTQALQPASITLSGTGYSGSVTLPAINAAPLRLRASSAGGIIGESAPFDIMRVLPLATGDLVWDSGRGKLYASVPLATGGTYGNKVVAINPQTLAISGSAATNQDPGQLALTSGGEYLYAALNANGTVAKINPDTLTVASSFAIGTSSYYGTLYAEDMVTVAGQPNLLVVSQYRKSVSPRHNGVAVYDNGVARATMTPDHTGSNVIEASADPTVFFGQNTETTEFGFRKMKLDANGITVTDVVGELVSGFGTDIRSDGNRVFSMSGTEVDGAQLKKLGSFNTSGIVRPDMASNRVYFMEGDPTSSSSITRISAYDPVTFAKIKALTLPTSVNTDTAESFIRWGSNGLAFRTETSIVLINSSQLVPSEAPANLAVTVQATPNPANVGSPLVYTVKVTNQGPNVARATVLSASLSDSQALAGTTASTGVPATSGMNITLPVGQLAVGASATLTITATPQSAGSLTCTANASSYAVDPDSSDNIGFQLVSVGFQSGANLVNQLRLPANNLIYDATRKVFWASLPATVPAPLGRSVVSIDPLTGLISNPIPIGASPMGQSMALSANGRYLYVGLSDVPEVHRIDLSTTPASGTRITLGSSQWGSLNYAQDLEILDGDGTSFMMAGKDDHSAAIYDATVRRNARSGIYTVDRIERSSTANIFLGYNNYTSGFQITKLLADPSGVTISKSVSNVISGYSLDVRAEGTLLLSSNGRLVDADSLALKSNLSLTGRPMVDARYQRVYLVNGNAIRGYDANTGTSFGSFSLPTTSTGDWALGCTRWGNDGFGVLGGDGRIYIGRWSASIPPGGDQNNDGIPDAWALQYFGSASVSASNDADGDNIADALEYLFGTNPCIKNTANPLVCSTCKADASTALRLTFPRRAGVGRQSYSYESSSDLSHWNTISGVTESILSTRTVDGVQTETIEAVIPTGTSDAGFLRLKWLQP